MHKKMKFSIEDFSHKCGQSTGNWEFGHTYWRNSLMGNFVRCSITFCYSNFMIIDMSHRWHYLFKVNNKNTRKRCEICSKLTIKTPERCHWYHSGVFIVNFEQISHTSLIFPLLTLNKLIPAWVISPKLHDHIQFRSFVFPKLISTGSDHQRQTAVHLVYLSHLLIKFPFIPFRSQWK